MSGEDLKVGQLVYSKAGRDGRRPFLVWRVELERIYLVDGKNRRIAKPKPKNPSHIQPTHQVASDIAARLAGGEMVSDADVRRAIESLTSSAWLG